MAHADGLKEETIHKSIDTFMDLCEILDAEHPSVQGNVGRATQLIEGIFRRNLKRLKAIHLLINGQEDFVGPSQEIMRNMVEDALSVEYIFTGFERTKNEFETEELLERFFDFRWVQLKADLEFYKIAELSLEGDGFAVQAKEIDQRSDKMIKKYAKKSRPFKDKSGLAHSWLRKGLEDIIKELRAYEKDDDERLGLIGRVYVQANRHTHFNPQAVIKALGVEDDLYFHETDPRVQCYESYVIGALCMCWLTWAYLDNVPPKPEWDVLEERLDEIEDTFVDFISHLAELHY